MSAYWVILSKLTVLLIAACLLLRSAPARWRFRLAVLGLGAALVPWQALPGIEVGVGSGVPALLLQPGAIPGEAGSNRGASTAQGTLAPWLLPGATVVGLIAFAFMLLRQLGIARRWYRWSRPAPELSEAAIAEGAAVRILPASRIAATSGFRRPVIWIGDRLLADRRLKLVLGHERIHVRHGDFRWVWLITAIRCLLWWNPAVWLWTALARRELEFSCDEACAAQFGTGAYRAALAELMHEQLTPSPLLPFIARGSFNIRRLTHLEKNPMKGMRQQLVVLLTALVLPLVAVPLVVAEDGSPGGTSIVENEGGISVRADGVPTVVFLHTIAGRLGFRTLHVHPSARTGSAQLAAEGPDWTAVLPLIFERLGLAYRVEGKQLIVAPADEIQGLDWLREGISLGAPGARQIGADLKVIVDGEATTARSGLLLTDGNWSGFLEAGLRVSVRPVLLDADRVQLEFSILRGNAESTSAMTPVLITEYGRVAAVQMGSTDAAGSPRSLRIEVIPLRL